MQYVDRLERVYEERDGFRPGFSFDTGVIGHAALAAFYKGESITEALNAAVNEQGIDPDGHEAYAARAAVKRYLLWVRGNRIEERRRIVSVEERLYWDMGEILGDHVVMTVQPDLIYRDQFGALRVLDHKFVVKYSNLASFILYNRQGLTYSLVASKHHNEPVAAFTLNQVMREMPKTVSRAPAERITAWIEADMLTEHEIYLRRIVRDMVQLHQEVEAGDEAGAYPHPTMLCDKMCSFKEICCEAIAKSKREVADIKVTRFRVKKDSDL